MSPHRFPRLLVCCLLLGCGTEYAPTEARSDAAVIDWAASELEPLDSLGGVGSLSATSDESEGGLLALERVSVRASQQGDMANVEVEHLFRNDAESVLEGTFRFPLPPEAILTGLSLWVDGRELRGELVEHEKARRVYEQIVDDMRDPALLEWEHGASFKLRVFPIAAHEHKRVLVRYCTPLVRAPGGLSFAHGARSPSGGKIARLTVDFEGERVFDEADVAPERVVEVAAKDAAPVLGEERADGSYRVLRLRPDWSRIPLQVRPVPKTWLLIADSSRSGLEERALLLDSLRAWVERLPAGSRFVLATSDLTTELDPRGLAPTTAGNLEAALRVVVARGNEGATDLGAALTQAGKALQTALRTKVVEADDLAVLYLGDALPTWGEERADSLAAMAKAQLAGAPLHVVLLGSGPDAVAAKLADATGGRLLRARTLDQVRKFAGSLMAPTPYLPELALSADSPATIVSDGRTALAAGDELTVALKSDPGAPAPRTLHVTGRAGTELVRFDLPLAAQPAAGVASRFGALWVRQLERAERAKEEVVAASLAYQVMSQHTSFLVLDSERAYAEHQIARRSPSAHERTLEGPQITGADLESASAESASLNVDRMQPGDPELYVHAPEAARRVTVTFPFGETKQAHYDREADGGRGAWMVRFLVPLASAEGKYEAVVEIVHEDGRRELQRVSYTVDRTAPALDVSATRSERERRSVTLRVRALGPERDLRQVEARGPNGTIVTLRARRAGQFEGRLEVDPARPAVLRIVASDRALNHTALELRLP